MILRTTYGLTGSLDGVLVGFLGGGLAKYISAATMIAITNNTPIA
jgi:hypothetical protein